MTKAANKPNRFYHVLSAGKLAPTVPSDQGFYQSLWDDPSRSKSSLKRSAPQATLQAKKSKTSSSVARAVSPQSASKSPLPPSPPTSFDNANTMVQEAWKVVFPSLHYPVELIGLFPSLRHQQPPALMHQPTNQ
jgi:hypothetical protein